MLSVLTRILGLRPRAVLWPLERRLLAAVEGALAPEARGLFAGQIAALNLVQRHAQAQEVCCYTRRLSSVARDPRLQFPNRSPDLRLATVRFGLPDRREVWTAKFYLVSGYFFSIVYNLPTAEIRNREDIRLLEVTINADLLQQAATADAPGRREVHFAGWLTAWAERYQIEDARPPLPGELSQERLAQLDALLPADYMELTAQADGLSVGGCTVLGLAEVREVVMEEGNYLILAELGGSGVLAVREGSADRQVYLLDYENEARQQMKSFREAVEGFLTAGGT